MYADRVRLAEAYDRAGYLRLPPRRASRDAARLRRLARPGPAPAIAQRTTRLRFGPLVYLLPYYHPVRLIEEVCMLDQMSGGRFELGIGRSVSPLEADAYDVDFKAAPTIYREGLQVLLQGPSSDELSFAGEHYNFHKVPMVLRPVQRPHPPLWAGVLSEPSADWPAQNDVHMVSLGPREKVRAIVDRYRAQRAKLGKSDDRLIGVGRHVVVADTDAEALTIARRAYPRWVESFRWLWVRNGTLPGITAWYPDSFDQLAGAQPRHRRLAAHGARFHRSRHRSDRRQLFPVLVRVRRSHAYRDRCVRSSCSRARSCLPSRRVRTPRSGPACRGRHRPGHHGPRS